MNPPFRGISTLYRKVLFREVAVVKVATELNTLTSGDCSTTYSCVTAHVNFLLCMIATFVCTPSHCFRI